MSRLTILNQLKAQSALTPSGTAYSLYVHLKSKGLFIRIQKFYSVIKIYCTWSDSNRQYFE